MAFTFVHSADWQLGKPFGDFDPELAALLKEARLSAIDRLAAVADRHRARDIVVCGDIFDSPGLAEPLLQAIVARLGNHARLRWHLLPGNHDPAKADGVWQRLERLGLPGNVRPLLRATVEPIATGVVLLPAPLSSKTTSVDPTAWMDEAVTPPGTIRIGVAHGSTQGFGSAGSASVRIDPARRQSARLDYLALGDWHGVREVAAGVWYSGTPEPDQFPDNEPGFALVVTIAGAGAAPCVERAETGRYTWLKRELTVSSADDLATLAAEIAALGPAQSDTLLHLGLSGIITLADDAALRQQLALLAPRLRHMELNDAALHLDHGRDVGQVLADAQLAAVATRLEAMRSAGDQADVAEGAMRRLYALARRAEEVRQ